MNGFIGKRGLAGATALGLAITAGCTCCDLVDPCYPERYSAAAREEVHAAMAPQVSNGHVLDQTIWNYDFESGTDLLTPAGRARLDYIARRRPAPDTNVFLQEAQDVAYEPANPEAFMRARNALDTQRVVAVQKYLNAVTAERGLTFNVVVHNPPQVGLSAIQASVAVQKLDLSAQGTIVQYGTTSGH